MSRVYRHALAIYRGQFARVVLAAFLVLFPTGLLENAADGWLEALDDNVPDGLATGVLFLSLFAGFAASLGQTAFAGLLDKVVGEQLHGHPRLSLGAALRSLPYRRLIVADILLTVLTTIGTLLFVLPGVIVFTLFALVGPIINIENLSVLGAFRRSARLVRAHPWIVLFAVTIPLLVEAELEDIIHEALHNQHPVLVALVLSGVLSATIGAIIGLAEVVLTYELIARHPAAAPDAPGGGT